MSWLAKKRILVTGGNGFLGRYVVGKLKQQGCKDVFIPRSKDYNLVEMEAVRKVYRDAQPDIVIHLAGIVGGIGANMNNPGSFFYKNLMMEFQIPSGTIPSSLSKLKDSTAIRQYVSTLRA